MKNKQKIIIRIFLFTTLVSLLLLLAACSGSGGGYTATLGSQNAPTVGASCTLADANGNTLLTGVTGADGTVVLNGLNHNGMVVLTCTGGSYLDEATGNMVNPAPTLRAAFNYAGGANLTAIASPLSEIAYRRADAAGDIDNVANYNNEVADQFGLDGIEFVNTVPENLNDGAVGNTPAGHLGVVLAILSQMATDHASPDEMMDSLVNIMVAGGIESSTIRAYQQALENSGQGASAQFAASGDAWATVDSNLDKNPDTNDTAPVMTSANSANVAENTTAVLTLSASDADSTGEAITYALGGTDAALFQVNGDALSLQTAPDFETPICGNNSCSITITPSDGANTGNAQSITVAITDVNDAAPAMTSANSADVEENTTAVLTLVASDADSTGETITYALGGTDAALFQVSGNALSLQTAPDYESPICGDNSCSISITPSDGTNTGNAQSITVAITDVNDAAPAMTSANAADVAENSTAVLTLVASDADSTGEAITYALGGTDAALFQVNGDALSLQTAPDFETPICGDNSCSISITPSDGANTGNAQTITVTITDLPSLTIADISHDEGDSGTSTAQLTVTLSSFVNPVDVDYATSDGMATTADNDYMAASATLSFTGGSTAETIDVIVHGDTKIEEDETLSITLGNPVNAELGSPASATLTITNDDNGGVSVPLNDTGITWGGNYSSGNNADCTGETIAQQDCSHGRDAQAEAGTLQKVGDGLAGFDFSRLNADGSDYTGDGDYATNPWACVRDNHTGLVWEVKTDDDGLHDKDNTYTWYNTDSNTNGGADGQQNTTGTSCFGYNDATHPYCNTQAYVNRVNAAGLCGATDWRLPSLKELAGIAHKGIFAPAIDTGYFPNTQSGYYWSSSPAASSSYAAWALDFGYGDDDTAFRFNADVVRLVRGGSN